MNHVSYFLAPQTIATSLQLCAAAVELFVEEAKEQQLHFYAVLFFNALNA